MIMKKHFNFLIFSVVFGFFIQTSSRAQILSHDDGFLYNPTSTVIGNVLDNDTINGDPVLAATISLHIAQTLVYVPIHIDVISGDVSVDAGLAPGTYLHFYTICDNLNPNNCSSASVVVTIAANILHAVDDVVSVFGTDCGIFSVLSNDLSTGVSVFPSDITLSSIPTNGISLNADGTISIENGTPSGTYCVPYTICENFNNNNCSSANVCVTVSNLSASSPVFENLKVFPNPISSGFITVSNAQNMDRLTLISVLGQTVFDKTTTELTSQIDINGLSVGLYFLKIKNKNQEQVVKIIKN